jgi:hypothetical protein
VVNPVRGLADARGCIPPTGNGHVATASFREQAAARLRGVPRLVLGELCRSFP